MLKHIHIVNGPNLNLIGKRELSIYGNVPFESYLEELRKDFPDIDIAYFQSNHEGDLIDYLHQHGYAGNTGIILNAAGLTHTSISLRDAVAAIDVDVVEVHISDISKREDFRKHSFISEVAAHHIIGKGLPGYKEAIEWLVSKHQTILM